MDFSFSPQENSFREQVHNFLESLGEIIHKAKSEWDDGLPVGSYTKQVWLKLGEKGWNCPHWPKEYGGAELPHVYRYILEEEYSYFGIRNNRIGSALAGPIILRYGNEEQKQFYLPRIARGEIELALGYTEPDAGSDLASIKMKAEDKGDYFLLNGQKLFNSAVHYAQYHWLMARTEATTPKHKGLSFFIVDLETPGISIEPVWVLGGRKATELRTNAVFYNDVKVPKGSLVGERNRGFYMLVEALASERTSSTCDIELMWENTVEYFKKIGKNNDPLVRQKIAELRIELEILKLLGMKISWMVENKEIPTVEAALAKKGRADFMQNLANLQVNTLGLYGLLHKDSKWVMMDGVPEWMFRNFLMERITRGTPEIVWNTIAYRGLGMPRT